MKYDAKALELYFETLNKGVADIDGKLKRKTEKTIEEYKTQVEELAKAIENSKEYITKLESKKSIAATEEEKDNLANAISIEKNNIAAMQNQIKTFKTLINGAKDKLKEFVEREELIEKGLSGALNDLKEEDKKLTNAYQLWYEITGEELPEEIVKEKHTNLLNQRLEVQAERILEIKAAYDQLVAIYGNTNKASIAMENQLLSECVTYEKLKDSIAELSEVEGYSQEQINNAIYDMNDYLKNNYKQLKEAGFSDDVIYAAARGSSGYDKYLETLNKKGGFEPTENDIVNKAEGVVQGLSEKFSIVTTTFATGVESTVTNLISSISDILRTTLSQVPQSVKSNVSSVQNNNVTNNYTVKGAGERSIYSSINALKNFEALKKARGV